MIKYNPFNYAGSLPKPPDAANLFRSDASWQQPYPIQKLRWINNISGSDKRKIYDWQDAPAKSMRKGE